MSHLFGKDRADDELSRTAEVFAIGIGEAGSNLVGSYLAQAREKSLPKRIRGYLLINTDRSDLLKVRKKYGIPKENTLLYGSSDIGVGGRFMDGYQYVIDSKEIIMDQLRSLGFEGVSGFVIFTSLGGGTGCGGTPALIELLKQRFQEEEHRRIFVYVMGVLPFEGQSSEALNSIWAISKLLRAQLQDRGADLLVLLSNRTMLKRVLAWRSGETIEFLHRELNVDIADISQVEKMVPSTIDSQSEMDLRTEQAFVELVNPLALKAVDHMLNPGIYEPGKDVFPNTDLADYSRRLDPVVVPALYDDVGLIPDAGSMPKQISTMVDYTIKECSYADVGDNPAAESVFYVFSGHKNIARAEYGPYIKDALRPYLSPGAAITPCYVQYQDEEVPTTFMALLGLPKIPELTHLINEATQLVNLHSGPSLLKQSWFMRSKGVPRKELVDAINDVKELFSYYMAENEGVPLNE